MQPIWLFILIFFVSGLYVSLHYTSESVLEGFKPRCPNILIQNGNELLLKNTNLADIPGVNPIIFRNLQEYTEFVEWQRSQGIKCPILYLQKSYSAQNEPEYHVKPVPKHLVDATRNDPPYNRNSYPGIDIDNQDIGRYTKLDEYGEVEQKNTLSKNPMDPNWGGHAYTDKAIEQGIYKDNEVSIAIPSSTPIKK
jgi:hypothetical protein